MVEFCFVLANTFNYKQTLVYCLGGGNFIANSILNCFKTSKKRGNHKTVAARRGSKGVSCSKIKINQQMIPALPWSLNRDILIS